MRRLHSPSLTHTLFRVETDSLSRVCLPFVKFGLTRPTPIPEFLITSPLLIPLPYLCSLCSKVRSLREVQPDTLDQLKASSFVVAGFDVLGLGPSTKEDVPGLDRAAAHVISIMAKEKAKAGKLIFIENILRLEVKCSAAVVEGDSPIEAPDLGVSGFESNARTSTCWPHLCALRRDGLSLCPSIRTPCRTITSRAFRHPLSLKLLIRTSAYTFPSRSSF